ncbi:MAG: hypothetical protein U5K27_20250 [Desulfotignum sp.]|nr:hypothetical protein [Desulfotignum sp.]
MTLGDLHSISTIGRPFNKKHDVRDDVMLGAGIANLELTDRNKSVVCQRILSKSINRTVGLCSPVFRFSLTLVFSISRCRAYWLFSDKSRSGKAGCQLLGGLFNLIIFKPGLITLSCSRSTFGMTTSVKLSRENVSARGLLIRRVRSMISQPNPES